jgi:hypothetical protein
MNQNLIYYCRSKIFGHCHIFKRSVSYLYLVILLHRCMYFYCQQLVTRSMFSVNEIKPYENSKLNFSRVYSSHIPLGTDNKCVRFTALENPYVTWPDGAELHIQYTSLERINIFHSGKWENQYHDPLNHLTRAVIRTQRD